MRKIIVILLGSTLLLAGCDEANETKDVVATGDANKESVDEDNRIDYSQLEPGTPEYDRAFYLRGYNDLEMYDGEDLRGFLGIYSTIKEDDEEQLVKNIGEIREDGFFTFYEVPLVTEENQFNQSYKRAGYYLDDDMVIQKREGHLIPWDEPVRIRSGYIARAYGELRMVLINDVSFIPSLNTEGTYDFTALYSGFGEHTNDTDEEFIGEALEMNTDGKLTAGTDFALTPADMSDFDDMFSIGEIRSADLVRNQILKDASERKVLREELGEHEGATYFYEPQEFQLDFRFIEVITDTEEYNRYARDNTLLEMDYVFEYEDDHGTLLAVYGFRNHTLYQLEQDEWVPM